MREQIILAPGAKGSELTKSLAMHGVNTFNLRICGAGELARLGMMRSGLAISEDFLSAREEAALISEAVKGETYFGKLTYSDICDIAGAIRRMRSLIPSGDEASQLADTLAKGTYSHPGATRSQCISSEITVTPYFKASSPTFAKSSLPQIFPTGL